MRIIAVLMLVLLSGCTALKYPGLAYASWKQDLRNDRSERQYSKTLASQAKNNQLAGTWTRVEVVPLGKKITNQRVTHYTLTLFHDSTYVYRVDRRESFSKTVSVTKGGWSKLESGMIRLTPSDLPPGAAPLTLSLSGWTNPFVETDRRLRESPEYQYASSVMIGSDETPIIVLHHCEEDDIGGVLFGAEFHEPRFLGPFVPDAGLVRRADEALLERLKKEKPGKAYLRQYAGYRTSSIWRPEQRYLWVQLTAAKTLEDEPALGGFGWPRLLEDFNVVNDGGDDFGEAIYDVETGIIISLTFNSNV